MGPGPPNKGFLDVASGVSRASGASSPRAAAPVPTYLHDHDGRILAAGTARADDYKVARVVLPPLQAAVSGKGLQVPQHPASTKPPPPSSPGRFAGGRIIISHKQHAHGWTWLPVQWRAGWRRRPRPSCPFGGLAPHLSSCLDGRGSCVRSWKNVHTLAGCSPSMALALVVGVMAWGADGTCGCCWVDGDDNPPATARVAPGQEDREVARCLRREHALARTEEEPRCILCWDRRVGQVATRQVV